MFKKRWKKFEEEEEEEQEQEEEEDLGFTITSLGHDIYPVMSLRTHEIGQRPRRKVKERLEIKFLLPRMGHGQADAEGQGPLQPPPPLVLEEEDPNRNPPPPPPPGRNLRRRRQRRPDNHQRHDKALWR